MKGGEDMEEIKQYKESLLASKSSYEERLLEERLNKDSEIMESIVSGIESLFRRDYITGEEVVTVHIIPKVSYPVFGYNLVEQTHSTELPHYMLLMVRYELAKRYGIVFNSLKLIHLTGSYDPQARVVKIPTHEITLKLF